MANERIKVKNGMGGSRCGRGRTAGTATYKKAGKKKRRQQGKNACSGRGS
jgi:hypothetical protein